MLNEFREWMLFGPRVIHFSAAMLSALAYEYAGRKIYRPYIYENGLNDLHIADTLGNTFGTTTVIFLALALFSKGRKSFLPLVALATLSVILYELLHPFLGKPIDPWDMLASAVIGAIFCVVLMYKIGNTKAEV